MKYGICLQSMVPLRESPSHKSQMTNQLLFGDLFLIKDKTEDWFFVESIDDNYEAWLDEKQTVIISESDFKKIEKSPRAYSLEDCTSSHSNKKLVKYTLGSSLPLYSNNNFHIVDEIFPHTKQVQHPSNLLHSADFNEIIILLAKKYLNSPYLWGGRSVFGIDCSGLTQIVFKMAGIFLPRDASQQIKYGETISFLEETKQGDLAFFENEEGNIVHVGILIDNQTIIHSSGSVRIDKIDHHGIYDGKLKKYTHKLRLIKRFSINP